MTSLDCLLMADKAAERQMLSNCLRISRRIGTVRMAANRGELAVELERAEPDLAALIVDAAQLPPCLLRYPKLRVLAITRQRRIGRLLPWLQQGASDVVSLYHPDAVPHALGRLVDECLLEARLSEAEAARDAAEIQLAETLAGRPPRGAVTPRPTLPTLETDSVTGLASERTALARWQRLIDRADPGQRQFACLIALAPLDADEPRGKARMLLDLLALQATDRLHWSAGGGPEIVARVGLTELLAVHKVDKSTPPPRLVAASIEQQLAPLLDKPNEVRIVTLNLPLARQPAAVLLSQLRSDLITARPGIARYAIQSRHVVLSRTERPQQIESRQLQNEADARTQVEQSTPSAADVLASASCDF